MLLLASAQAGRPFGRQHPPAAVPAAGGGSEGEREREVEIERE